MRSAYLQSLTGSKRLLALAALIVLALCAAPPRVAATSTSPGGWKFAPTINAPWAQEDDDTFDSAVTASGLCRSSQFTATNPYLPTTNVDVIAGDVSNNSGFSNFHCITPQNETTVAVNPHNPNNLVAGANDYRVCCDFTGLNDGSGWVYTSFDGGLHWTNVQLPGLTAQTGGKGTFQRVDSAGDPAVTFGPDGTVYYANIVFSRVSLASGVAVSVSHDGGLTWSEPDMVTWSSAGNFFNDKEFIAAGPAGQVVVTWTSYSLGPHGSGYRESPIVMALSKDGGHSWTRQGSPVSDRSHPYDQGSIPLFAPDGTLYVVYEGATPSSGYTQDATIVARSTDGGETFTNREVGRVYDDLDCYPTFAERQTLTGEHFRVNSFPSFSIDPANGRLAIVWADNRGAGNCGTGASSFVGVTSAKVVIVTSSDGTTFAAPAVVSGGDTVFPAVAANNGKIAVSYYTRAYAASHNPALCKVMTGTGNITEGVPSADVCLDYAARSSSNAFATETRLSTEGSNPFIAFADGAFIGDYSQIALGTDGVAHPVWTDFRGDPNPGGTQANQDVYTTMYLP